MAIGMTNYNISSGQILMINRASKKRLFFFKPNTLLCLFLIWSLIIIVNIEMIVVSATTNRLVNHLRRSQSHRLSTAAFLSSRHSDKINLLNTKPKYIDTATRLLLPNYYCRPKNYLNMDGTPFSFGLVRKQQYKNSHQLYSSISNDASDEETDFDKVNNPVTTHEDNDNNGEVISLSDLENEDEEDYDNDVEKLPKGVPDGFYVIKQYFVSSTEGLDLTKEHGGISKEEIERLDINNKNVTLPIALMILDPETYPSLSRARKACRKGTILIHRGPLGIDENTGEASIFDKNKCLRGRVPDRVFPGDVIGKQVRMGGINYPQASQLKAPFDLPVVYEDDHFAIVNKPAGVVVYSHKDGGHGRMTVRSCLPYALKPPKKGTIASIRRPVSVHRLDKPTSGLLLVAKTKPAMMDLSRQFVERQIQKTYTAIVNGIPFESKESAITASEAKNLGVDVDDNKNDPADQNNEDSNSWQLIDHSLEGKSAVTVWRPLRYIPSLRANEKIMTMVELKPKTGRYHQLRRHMAWVCDCPLIGDKDYDGGGEWIIFRERGLFLCSNKVVVNHPYYNTEIGRKEFDTMSDEKKTAGGMIYFSEIDNLVKVQASIDLPAKFSSFLKREEQRFHKFEGADSEKDGL